MDKELKDLILYYVILFLCAIVADFLLAPTLLRCAWNYGLVNLFSALPTMNFWQAFWIMVGVRVLKSNVILNKVDEKE